MDQYVEREGISRRQFVKGSAALVVSVGLLGVFAKFGVSAVNTSDDYIAKRAAGLYSLDEKMAIRKSHENPEIVQIYKEFLSPGEVKPLTQKSHHLLHTRYGKDIPAMIEALKQSHV